MESMVIPSYIQIETIAGKCSANCIMCNIRKSPRNGEMNLGTFCRILERFAPYIEHQKFMNLQGLGETLLDSTIIYKVSLAKSFGFKGIGFATNATHLNRKMAHELLGAGLDTLIISLDGINKDTHEKIRRVNYPKVLKNVMNFIDMRNGNGKTKIIIRMIRQDLNRNEWDEYREFWKSELNPTFGDQVAAYDVWGTEIEEDRQKRFDRLNEWSSTKKEICPDLLNRMLLLINGDVILCCGDMRIMGNVLDEDPKDIYNGPGFRRFRQYMKEGNLALLPSCKNCQVILSSMDKVYVDATGTQASM